MLLLLHQVEHTPGSSWPQRVPIGRPSSAVKPMVEATELPLRDRAQRGAVAEMGDDDPAARRSPARSAQPPRDEFVGQAVEAVAPHAFVVIARAAARRCRRRRDGCGGRRCRNRRPAASRESVERRLDAGDVVRLVQGAERDQGAERREQRLVDARRLGEVAAAVEDAVADRGDVAVDSSPCGASEDRRIAA